MIRSVLAMSTSLVALTIAAQAAAQSTSPPVSTAPNATGDQIQEVVVTALKTGAQQLQKTPAAVSVVSGALLQNRQIDNVANLAPMLPDVVLNSNLAAAEIYIRGIGSNNNGAGSDPDVTQQVDGVYIARTTQQNFLDVQDVEVLRGPQGTLYGRNAIAGTINITSRQPSHIFQGEVVASGGNYDMGQFGGYVSGPLVDSLYGSFAINYLRHDGYFHNVVPGQPDVGTANNGGVRGQLRWEPTSNIDATTRVDMELSKEILQNNAHLIVSPAAVGVTGAPGNGYYSTLVYNNKNFGDVALNTPQPADTYLGGIAEEVNWRFAPNFSLKSITAFRTTKAKVQIDVDSMDANKINSSYLTSWETDRQYSQEFDLNYNSDRFVAVSGLYYYQDFDDQHQKVYIIVPIVKTRQSSPDVDSKSMAAFAQGTYNFTQQLSVVLGARYTYETKTFSQDTNGTGVGAFPPILFSMKHNYDDVTPKAGVNFQVNRDVLLYASVTAGYKSGGYNYAGTAPGYNNASNPSGSGFLPETVWSYEGGAKTQWLDRRLQLNATVFYYDYTNMQVQQLVAAGNIQIQNAPATDKGLELEAIARPIPDLTFTANASLLDARYGDFKQAYVASTLQSYVTGETCAPIPHSSPSCYANASGKTLINAPKYSGFVGADYTHHFENYALTGHVDFSWKSRVYFDPSNAAVLSQSDYGLVNMNLTLTPSNKVWSAELFIRNLANRTYYTTEAGSGTVPDGVGGDPRTFGMTVTRNW